MLFLLPRAVRGTDSGDGRHPPRPSTGISLIPAALIASIVTLAYTWSGGILAVTLTDAVQYVIIVIGVTLCAYLAIDHLGGFDA